MTYHHIGITVSFNQSEYSVFENVTVVQPVLILSNPSSTNISVQVTDNGDTAFGKLNIIIIINLFN